MTNQNKKKFSKAFLELSKKLYFKRFKVEYDKYLKQRQQKAYQTQVNQINPSFLKYKDRAFRKKTKFLKYFLSINKTITKNKKSYTLLKLSTKKLLKQYYGLNKKKLKRIENSLNTKTQYKANKLLQHLEQRLDNVLVRARYEKNIKKAQIIIKQGIVLVNYKKIKHPGYLVKDFDIINVTLDYKRLFFYISNHKKDARKKKKRVRPYDRKTIPIQKRKKNIPSYLLKNKSLMFTLIKNKPKYLQNNIANINNLTTLLSKHNLY